MTANSFRLLGDGEEPKSTPCCPRLQFKLRTHPFLHAFMFISIVTLDITEILNDCLLFKDIASLRQGLVYGPLHPLFVYLLLVCTAIGSLVLTLEIINLVCDMITSKPWLDLDLLSAISVWFDDIPIITINVFITFCHSEPVSSFQLSKAVLGTLSVLLRIMVPLMRTFVNKHVVTVKEKFRKTVYKVLTTIGLMLVLCGSVSIFTFTHIIAIQERQIQFRLPQEIWEGKFAFDRYFTDVGIYFHPKDLRFKINDETEEYWIKLTTIQDFNETDNIHVKISYIETNKVIQKFKVSSYNTTSQRYYECYSLQNSNNDISHYVYQNCTANFLGTNGNIEMIIFKFVFVLPGPHLILGDIGYVAKCVKNNICYDLWSNTTDIYNRQENEKEPTLIGKMLYFKHVTKTHENHRLVHRNTTSSLTKNANILLFDTDHFLLSAEDTWKTGMYGCKCTGKKGPTMNSSLSVSC